MASVYLRKTRLLGRLTMSTIKALGKPKIFCVGMNKTGTTSLAKVLNTLGFTLGNQHLAERYLLDWSQRDFHRLFWYCHTAQAFQDIPFSLPYTFQALDQRFRGSKFILTLRDDPQQWYRSLLEFYSRLLAHGRPPTLDDLQAATYHRPGFLYQANRLIATTPPDDPFNQDSLIARYNAHNASILEYFRHRPGDLLVLNVAEPGAYRKLSDFLDLPPNNQDFPWENRTSDLKV